MKTILFVCYGSGHVRMVVPVAQAVVAAGLARVKVLALTTAAPVVRAAQLDLLRIKDFVRPGNSQDLAALETGRRLMADMPSVADPDETAAYLGLSYAELAEDVGADAAAERYARDGRQAFSPRRLLERVLREVAPDLVFATNSPRAERAAIQAARTLNLPSICLVDLFCFDEISWIGQPSYADHICVLNESVKAFVVAAGRDAAKVSATGNPSFDTLLDPVYRSAGAQLRRARGWTSQKVVLWPVQEEPAFHPINGTPGDALLPAKALREIANWVMAHTDTVLCVRTRIGGQKPLLPQHPRLVVTGQDIELAVLLQAVDLVVTLNSTVGLEGYLTGLPVVQVLGSLYDDAVPLKRHGLADEAVPVSGVADALTRGIAKDRRPVATDKESACTRVLEVVKRFL